MKITSSYSHIREEEKAVSDICNRLTISNPGFIVCYYTEEYSAAALCDALTKAFPKSKIHGCSSSSGVMTDEGYHEGPVVAVLAIADDAPFSSYGTAIQHFPEKDKCNKQRIKLLTHQVLEQAIKNADRIGELPDLVIIHSTFGYEEFMVEQVEEQLGGRIKLIGGSAADNNLTGDWSIITETASSDSGLSISVLYPSKPLLTAFSSGYAPSVYGGTVTKAKGRDLIEINGKNAGEVYTNWVDEYLMLSENTFNSENINALFPLGRIAGRIFGNPYYKLSHPQMVNPDGSITLFTDIDQGEHIHLMVGGQEQLVNRAAQVTMSAINSQPTEIDLKGGINIFCAGSQQVIVDELDQIHKTTKQAYRNAPFICPFTYGEQGCFANGENAHGNLMLSSVIFYSEVTPL
ncbi:FIST C-terminal domain-containing protein [Vibrio sp. JC009]|uniref:FIST signal transduction protein n=1 Tax=Vibrio sp. JC009 TaxID=2912314 RepID=UPI0023B1D764|nr:FIST N-terminal domain-containing protein [Vibrio sp. JC009]WED23185.1 FIST C-terminal domain-containing protein [Vibrio sp. JC009]